VADAVAKVVRVLADQRDASLDCADMRMTAHDPAVDDRDDHAAPRLAGERGCVEGQSFRTQGAVGGAITEGGRRTANDAALGPDQPRLLAFPGLPSVEGDDTTTNLRNGAIVAV
jgi:hypothetical protein